jgi:hypothetical protein
MTFRKPMPPHGYTLETQQDRCPKCKATCIANIGAQKRCNECGYQWPPIQPSQTGPTRQEVLDGTARSKPAKIVFIRSCLGERTR